MSGLIGAAIGLATSICNLVNTEESMKYINDLKNHQMDLIAEGQKGDDADDGKIEALHQQIAVILQAVNNQYALQKSAPSATSAAH